MSETAAFLAERLAAEGEKTAAFFEALSPQDWQALVYSESEAWTIRSLLAHFVSAEQGFLNLFQDILAGGFGAQESFDIDGYNAEEQRKTAHVPSHELLVQFRAARAQMVALVASLTPEDLQKQGRHPFLGVTTLAEMVKMVYRHNQIHLRDLRKRGSD
ncbi:MAG: maleylpyruvate isomerase N-terminal domain-containing protein [Anaerolineales bacterium]|nr:maleylpyruvate isomerase N-terminal domain-containing protein [Anaerolineales bacterium]